MKKTLLLIDGYGFVFRAYHVQPSLTSPKGLPVGALYGFTSMLLKVLNDFKPEHAAVVLDTGGKNFRHQIYEHYKANRPAPPQELIMQLLLVKEVARSLNFAVIEKSGYEADDIIATVAHKAVQLQENVIIISSDKDLVQLMNEHIKIYDPMKGMYISEADIIKKFGVSVDKIHDVMALMGDKSDNIPGVPGIGPKTAAALITQFGSVEAIFNSLEQVENVRQKAMLTASQESALISWQLVGLDSAVDIDLDFNELMWKAPHADQLSIFLHEYGFKSLYKRAANLFSVQIIHHEEEKPVPELSNIKIEEILDIVALDKLIKVIYQVGIVAIYLIESKNEVISIALLVQDRGFFIKTINEANDLFTYHTNDHQDARWFFPKIQELLSDKSIKKITCGLKKILNFFGENVASCEDIELMKYTVSAGKPQKDLFSAVKDLVDQEEIILESTKTTASFAMLYQNMLVELRENQAFALYKEIDLPLCYVIHKMERVGIKIDSLRLKRLSTEFGGEIATLEQTIFTMAGSVFNIASPKQLGEVLFEKMQLPFGKISPKTKSYSTGVAVLEKLSSHGYQIGDLLLKWRQLSKLKNTYTDTLPTQVNPITGRIHTHFLQTSTSTSRLSSHNPNLQNVPIKSKAGNQIREAFIAKSGCKLISADYSQIELRILSHIADIPALKEAFIQGRDIHTQTACQIFNLSEDHLTKEQRGRAKAINFGIIYGIGAFSLAAQLNVSASQAADYIKKYFDKFPGIEFYMERTKAQAKECGYVSNLFGRKCYVPLIHDKKTSIRQFAERAAINAPIQSSNADIIKIAMIHLNQELALLGLQTQLILQIHDEFLLEAPIHEVETVILVIRRVMENAASISVPIVTEIRVGDHWSEIH